MAKIAIPPPLPVGAPDLSRPCLRCRFVRTGWLALLMGFAAADCARPEVRGESPDPVRGRMVLGEPVDCRMARSICYPCGPEGRYFEPKGGPA